MLFERNEHRDTDDYEVFAKCMTGPDTTIPPVTCSQSEFEAADLDDDSDVDHSDFAALGTAY